MPKVSKQSASHVDDHDRVSGHLLTVLFKNGTRLAGKRRRPFRLKERQSLDIKDQQADQQGCNAGQWHGIIDADRRQCAAWHSGETG